MAGKPPADAAHPSGMNGMMVTVASIETTPPSAPSIPAFSFQKLPDFRPQLDQKNRIGRA
jgi:hypothetical protein